MTKLTPSLIALHEKHSAHAAQRSTMPFSTEDALVAVVNDRVVVDAVASGDVEVLKSDLTLLGMQAAVAFGRTVSRELPVSSLSPRPRCQA